MFVEHLEANMCVHYHSIKIVWLLILCLVQKDGIFAKLFFNILSFAKLLNCTFLLMATATPLKILQTTTTH